ncbi:hypothetical protein [Bradyrhizobium sp. 25ACV]
MNAKVSISGRVIAAGPVGNDKVRLTISFMPGPAGQGIVDVDVETWPQWTRKIEEAIADAAFKTKWLRLVVAEIALEDGKRKQPPTAPAKSVALSYASEIDLGKIQELWEEVAIHALRGHEDMKGFELSEQKRDALLPRFWDGVAAVFNVEQARRYTSNSNGKTIPNVLGTGRADAAVLHLMARAKQLFNRIQSRGTDAFKADLDGTITGQDQPADLKDDWKKDTPEARAALDKALKVAQDHERNKILTAAAGFLSESKDYLVRAKTAIEQANKGTDEAILDYTRGDVPVTLSGQPLKKLLEDNDALLLGRVQNLHLASLLPDDPGTDNYRPKGAQKADKVSSLERGRPAAPVGESTDFVARTFVAAIRSSPMLARLFRFVIDVDVELPDAFRKTTNRDGADHDSVAFAFLAIGFAAQKPEGAGEPIPVDNLLFSIAKATFAQQDVLATQFHPAIKSGSITGFWPATREEVDLRCNKKSITHIRKTGAVSQIDGVVDLGQGIDETDEAKRSPRFDIVTIDPVSAMEASVRNARRHGALSVSEPLLELAKGSPRSAYQEIEPGLVTQGMAIVDRRRAESVAREVMSADRDPGFKLRVLDADDLTIGYRIDVAIRIGEKQAEWRSLMEREIDYRRAGHEHDKNKDEFREWFDKLGLSFESPRRRDYDAGTMMPTSRRRLFKKEDETTGEMIHAEERLATWTGDPLGLNCHSDEITVRPGSDIGISRSYSLPSEADEDDRKAWPLRYGWAYRFGIRPVWLGGASLSLGEATLRYDKEIVDLRGVTLPSALKVGDIQADSWRRFLRHEPILSPVLLLPEGVAVSDGKSELPPQSGIRAILRTLAIDLPADNALLTKYKDRQTVETWRVILPPQISLDEATRHGMFDQDDQIGKVPPGGLLAIDYDTALSSTTAPQTDLAQKKSGFPTSLPKPAAGGTDDDDPVKENIFRVHGKPKNASDRAHVAEQYYVDPMATKLVIAVRPDTNRPGTGYFEGARAQFDVTSGVMPVAIRIRAEWKLRAVVGGKNLAQKDFWENARDKRAIDGNAWKGDGGGAKLMAHVPTLVLHAGEAVDLDCWFVPSVEQLRSYFDWPETLAVKASVDGKIPTGKLADYRNALIEKLYDMLTPSLADESKLDDKAKQKAKDETAEKKQKAIAGLKKSLARYDDKSPWAGFANMLADPAAIAVAAELLHDHMMQFPIPEISAIRTIDAVHAIAQPPRAPQLGALEVVRTPSDDPGRLTALKAVSDAVEKGDPIPKGNRGDDGISFVGTAGMDRDTCRQLEIRAHCVSPARKLFDDAGRGRTELQRLLGEWPGRVVPKDGEQSKAGDNPSEEFFLSQSAKHLFGFDVDRQGRVYLPKQWITLLQMDDIVEEPGIESFAALESINLVEQQKITLERRTGKSSDTKTQRKETPIRAAPLDRYSDRLARQIIVALRATSRFDAHFLHLQPKDDLPETMFPPQPDDAGLITRMSYDDAADKILGQFERQKLDIEGKVKTLWIPATVAPAKPQVHAVLPSYAITRRAPLEGGDFEPMARSWFYCRSPRMRILLDRPWFSSGEGERLGLVVWPPQLREIASVKEGIAELTKGNVPRSVLHDGTLPSDGAMKLADFLDEDLGPGGKFTTRWGADPIRSNTGELGPFVPREAFVDLRPENDLGDVGYEPKVAIPLVDLRAEDDQKANDATAEQQNIHDTLTASLITYEPRFDVESEKWYIDVALNADRVYEPFVRFGLVRYQANALPGLQASAPVVSWGQVLPFRRVDVHCFKQDRDLVIRVYVSGPASGRLNERGADGKAETVFPRMRISVVTTSPTAAALRNERLAVTRTEDDNPAPAVVWAEHRAPPPASGMEHGPRVWFARFVVPAIEKRPNDIEQQYHSVLVEEVEDFLSTADEIAAPQVLEAAKPQVTQPGEAPAYAENTIVLEPVDVRRIPQDEPPEGISRSGPRFLARVDLTVDRIGVSPQPETSKTRSKESSSPETSKRPPRKAKYRPPVWAGRRAAPKGDGI